MENKINTKSTKQDKEIWVPVPDEPYNKTFMVSNKGQIKNINTGQIKTLLMNESTGFYAVRLDIGKKHKRITYQIHQLVAKMFIGECPDKHYVVHKDSNKENNYVSNLEYMSSSNMKNMKNKYSENKSVVKKTDSSSSESDSSESESDYEDKYCSIEKFNSLQKEVNILKEQIKILQQQINKPNIKEVKEVKEVKEIQDIPINNPDRKTIPNFKRYEIDKNGKVYIKGKDCEKQTFGMPNGYVRISLTADGDNSKNTKKFYVHRLVAETFIPNPKNLPYVNHKNSNKQDNRVENLEWCSGSENMKHNSTAKGTGKKVYAYDSTTGKFYKSFDSIKGASRELGIESTTITKVISGDRLLAGGYFWKQGDYKNEDDISDIDDELLEKVKATERYRKKKIVPNKEPKKQDSSESDSESDSDSQ